MLLSFQFLREWYSENTKCLIRMSAKFPKATPFTDREDTLMADTLMACLDGFQNSFQTTTVSSTDLPLCLCIPQNFPTPCCCYTQSSKVDNHQHIIIFGQIIYQIISSLIFFFLSSMPLFIRSPVCLFTHQLMASWGFSTLELMNEAAMNICIQVFV